MLQTTHSSCGRALMWMVNSLPAYRMASRWNTDGVIGCPIRWIAHGHSIYSTVEMRAILTATNSFPLSTIPTEGTRKPSRKNRVEYKLARPRLIGDQILDWLADISPSIDIPFRLWKRPQ
ncbi:UNVERIFIED_CONTAM: hypothetical protein Sindi_2007000, partial [Sesamum indicum]